MDGTTNDEDRTSLNLSPMDQPNHGQRLDEAMKKLLDSLPCPPLKLSVVHHVTWKESRIDPPIEPPPPHIYSGIASDFTRRMGEILAHGVFTGFDQATKNGDYTGVSFYHVDPAQDGKRTVYDADGNRVGEIILSSDDYSIE